MGQENTTNERTIDFVDLFKSLIAFIKKNLLKFILSGIVINILTVIYVFYIEIPVYRSNMAIFTNYFQIDDISVLVRKLNYLIESESYEELAKQLNLKYDDAKKIKRFSVQLLEFNKTEKEKSIDKQEEKFDISVLSYDAGVLDRLDKGFENYMMNDPFLSLKIASTKSRVIEMRNKLTNEISSLDSLKAIVGESFNKKDGKTNLFISSPSEINNNIIELYEKKVKFDAILQYDSGFGILQRFSHNSPTINIGLTKSLMIVNALGLIMTFIILGIINFIRENI